MDLYSKSVFQYKGEYPAPWTWLESVTTHIIGPARTAVPFRFHRQARATALSAGIPVDVHIPKCDVHRLAKAVILAGIECCLFYHHEMHVMPGAGACIIHVCDFHALPNVRASDFYTGGNAVFGDVQINLVGPGVGGAVLQGDAVGAA